MSADRSNVSSTRSTAATVRRWPPCTPRKATSATRVQGPDRRRGPRHVADAQKHRADLKVGLTEHDDASTDRIADLHVLRHRRPWSTTSADVRFADGPIVDHIDDFSFWKWSRHSLDPKPRRWLNAVAPEQDRGTAKAGLDKFMAKERAPASFHRPPRRGPLTPSGPSLPGEHPFAETAVAIDRRVGRVALVVRRIRHRAVRLQQDLDRANAPVETRAGRGSRTRPSRSRPPTRRRTCSGIDSSLRSHDHDRTSRPADRRRREQRRGKKRTKAGGAARQRADAAREGRGHADRRARGHRRPGHAPDRARCRDQGQARRRGAAAAAEPRASQPAATEKLPYPKAREPKPTGVHRADPVYEPRNAGRGRQVARGSCRGRRCRARLPRTWRPFPAGPAADLPDRRQSHGRGRRTARTRTPPAHARSRLLRHDRQGLLPDLQVRRGLLRRLPPRGAERRRPRSPSTYVLVRKDFG